MVGRYAAVLEHELAVIHEASAHRLVAARDGKPRRSARHEKARGALKHADRWIGVGVNDEKACVVAVADELLAAVAHPFAVLAHGAGVHRRLRYVVRKPPVGGAARLGEAVRE